MTDPVERSKELVEEAVEKPKELVAEADAGESARTPAIALTGVTMVIGAVLTVLVAAMLLIYYLT